jgi:uncharacterized membrane protein YphA (DoxX/SURF4 family)
MDTALWVSQGLLAALFTMTGLMKLTQPKEKLAEKMAWAQDYEPSQIKKMGIAELAGALGMILPMQLDLLPWLTPLAAAGLATIMMLAIPVHKRLNETTNIVINFAIMGLAFWVLVGRVMTFVVG